MCFLNVSVIEKKKKKKKTLPGHGCRGPRLSWHFPRCCIKTKVIHFSQELYQQRFAWLRIALSGIGCHAALRVSLRRITDSRNSGEEHVVRDVSDVGQCSVRVPVSLSLSLYLYLYLSLSICSASFLVTRFHCPGSSYVRTAPSRFSSGVPK